MTVRIGTAGWAIPSAVAAEFPGEGTALNRYAARFDAVEINSSFHRPHRLSTWERWRDSVPSGFRFAVKMPKTISHQRKLADCAHLLTEFLEQVAGLGDKLGALLLQLPPKLAFDPAVAGPFLRDLAVRSPAALACEPRHPSWFEPAADGLLAGLRIARVAADPAIVPAAAVPGGWLGLRYWRLHGSPRMYRSSYGDRIESYAAAIAAGNSAGGEAWCLFDNTAGSAATGDALALQRALAALPR